ncbi:MAG TPA: phosphotransferase [Thermoanaerobaculia bacterium]|nr:phosphotransferase [Thermoanaerobaculia bacterium]
MIPESSPPSARTSPAENGREAFRPFPSEFAGLDALARRTGHEPVSVEVLPGDVGRRRYLRLRLPENRTVLGVVYPPEESDSRRRWLLARAALEPHVRVPKLIADDGEANQLVEDFGSEDLAARLLSHASERERGLGSAVGAAAVVAGITDPAVNPAFDFALFRRELELAREAVFDLHLRQPLSPVEREAHDQWADALCREMLGHPRALCHRDFHGNNLFPSDDQVAAIDFQDMRTGPDSYDLASLLWERTTLDWMTPELAQAMIQEFARLRSLDAATFRRRFDRVLLQRAWKVCGTFARAVAQGRGEVYRRYLPGEIALVGRLLGDSEPDRSFRRVYEARLVPLLS